jgi:hypothetical protein
MKYPLIQAEHEVLPEHFVHYTGTVHVKHVLVDRSKY